MVFDGFWGILGGAKPEFTGKVLEAYLSKAMCLACGCPYIGRVGLSCLSASISVFFMIDPRYVTPRLPALCPAQGIMALHLRSTTGPGHAACSYLYDELDETIRFHYVLCTGYNESQKCARTALRSSDYLDTDTL